MAGPSLGEKLQAMPKQAIFLILILATTLPQFFKLSVPNEPAEPAIDFYAELMQLPTDKPVLIASDWTNSTRGESRGHFDALLRILMERNIKFCVYSMADPQAPQVAKDSIARINDERVKQGKRSYERWNDWVTVGFFPSAETATNALANDLKSLFGNRKDYPPNAPPQNVMNSPVMKGITRIQDFPALIVVTASKTSNITVERASDKVKLLFMVTGVMVPETTVFYNSKQIKGLSGGLKGVYDLETLMVAGVNKADANGKVTVKSDKWPAIEPYGGPAFDGAGSKYYPTLHFAVLLLIVMVVLGNVGMFLAKRGAK